MGWGVLKFADATRALSKAERSINLLTTTHGGQVTSRVFHGITTLAPTKPLTQQDMEVHRYKRDLMSIAVTSWTWKLRQHCC